MEQVSNYISMQMLKIVLLFTESGFVKQSRTVVLAPQDGNSLISLLPVAYLKDDVAVPTPLDLNCIKNDDFNSGVRYILQSVQDLPRDGLNPYEALSSHALKTAGHPYEINFQNMQSDKTIVIKLLADFCASSCSSICALIQIVN